MTTDPQRRPADHPAPFGPWAEPFGDLAEAAAALALAAAAARRRLLLDPRTRSTTVAVDHGAGRLGIVGLGASIGLAELATRLAATAIDRWPPLIADHVDTAIGAIMTASALRLHHWADVESRLVLRAVPTGNAGRHGEPLGGGIALDLAIDLGGDRPAGRRSPAGRVVAPTPQQVAAWAQPLSRVRRCAAANTRRRNRPAVHVSTVGDLRVTVLAGHGLTSGVLVDVGYFLRQASRIGANRNRATRNRAAPGRSSRSGRIGLASALTPQVVLVVEGPADSAFSACRRGAEWLRRCRAPLLDALAAGERSAEVALGDPFPPNTVAVDLGRPRQPR